MSEIVDAVDAVREMCQPGNVLRVNFGRGNPNNQLRHIRAVVDDDWVVYRVWTRRRRWRYILDWIYGFQILLEDGFLTLERKGKQDE